MSFPSFLSTADCGIIPDVSVSLQIVFHLECPLVKLGSSITLLELWDLKTMIIKKNNNNRFQENLKIVSHPY